MSCGQFKKYDEIAQKKKKSLYYNFNLLLQLNFYTST